MGSATTLVGRMGLQRFEQGLERMVEGVFSRSSRSSIRPVELGRRLLREMDDHRSVDVKGRRTVPNSFTFHLSARDHAGFADIEHALVTELAEAAREYASDEGYHLVGPISVAVLVDNNLKPGRFGIASVLRESTAQSNMPPSAPAPPPRNDAPIVVPPMEQVIAIPEAEPLAALVAGLDGESPLVGDKPYDAQDDSEPGAGQPAEGATRGSLVLPSGQRITVANDVITLGRLPECGLPLNDPNVSRRHAEVRPSPTGGVTVADLGSTNGTKVNGQRISGEKVLADGDIVSIGATHLRFEAS